MLELFRQTTASKIHNANEEASCIERNVSEAELFLDAYNALIVKLPMREKARTDTKARSYAAYCLATMPSKTIIADIGKVHAIERPDALEIAAMLNLDDPYECLICLQRSNNARISAYMRNRDITADMIAPSIKNFVYNISEFPSSSLESYLKAKETAALKLFAAHPSPRLSKNGTSYDIQSSNDHNTKAPFEQRVKARNRIFSSIREMQKANGCGGYASAVIPSIRETFGSTFSLNDMLLIQQYKAAGIASYITRQQNCLCLGTMPRLDPDDLIASVDEKSYKAAEIAYGMSSYCAEIANDPSTSNLDEALDIINENGIVNALATGVDVRDIIGNRNAKNKIIDVSGSINWSDWKRI